MADEIARILDLPPGSKPPRTVVDVTQSDVAAVNDLAARAQADFLTRLDYPELLELRR